MIRVGSRQAFSSWKRDQKRRMRSLESVNSVRREEERLSCWRMKTNLEAISGYWNSRRFERVFEK